MDFDGYGTIRYPAAVISSSGSKTTPSHVRHLLHPDRTPSSFLGPLLVGLVTFLGCVSLWLTVLGPTAITLLHVSALAAVSLLSAGLCRWIAGSPSVGGAASDEKVTERNQEEAFHAAERQALELVTKGTALNDVLAFICRTIESYTAPMLCSITLVTEDGGHLSSAAGPSLPDEYNRSVNGIPIGPKVGSCGSAAFFRQTTVVADIATDPLWEDYASMALAYGLKACWSQPIFSSTGALIGTFAAYYRESRSPQPADLKIVERASHIVALAIQYAKMNEALRESEERFQAFMTHSPAVSFIKDSAGRHLYVNPTFERLFGVSKEEVKNKTVFDFMPTEIAARLHRNDQCVFSTGQTLEAEETVPAANGTPQHWLVIKFPLDVAQGRLLGGVAFDITQRKLAEENLLRTRFAMDQAVDAVYWIDPHARILYTNDAASAMLGYTADEFLRMTVHDLNPNFPPEVWPGWWAETRERKVISLETVHLSKDGRWIPIDIRVSFLAYGGQEFHCAFVRDITERKRVETALRQVHDELEQRVVERTAQLAQVNRSLQEEIVERKRVEEAVRDSELRYKLLTDATFDGIAIHDQGLLLEVNPGLERMFGYEPGELVGRSILDLVAHESLEWVVANMREGVRGPYEAIGRRKDGSTFPGEVVVRPYHFRGKEVRLVAGRDITERKHLEAERLRYTAELEHQVAQRTAEIAKLEAQRAQAEKLAAMGRLAAGVAHEINNPIAGIKNAFTLVRQAVNPAHPHAEFVGMIDREITRVASIVQNMYQLYRPESGKVEPVELQTMMNDIQALFVKRLQQRRLKLTIDVDPCLERVLVPRGDLLQVLLNLLNNAIDCSSEGSRITLTLRVKLDVIRIAVSDEGPGIPPEILPHIFDPFYTTKMGSDQKGMGLGLSVSQSLVMSMGGTIEVETQPNRGSTFTVLLPRNKAVVSAEDRLGITEEVMTHDD